MTTNYITETPLLNDENYLSGFGRFWNELWNPGKTAALETEERLNQALLAAQAEQDRLDAEMTRELTELQNQLEAERLRAEIEKKKYNEQITENITSLLETVAVIVGFIALAFVAYKYF